MVGQRCHLTIALNSAIHDLEQVGKPYWLTKL
jgi:hypothetical protein